MNIYYRVSPFRPDNPAVVFPDDKLFLVKFSHDSFLKAGGNNYKTTYILDSCENWNEHFSKYGKIVNIVSHDKQTSLLTAYDFALRDGEDSFFVEDDYLWRPETMKQLENALKILKVLSPYDHPAHYTEERFDKHYETKLIDGFTYRACPSNTHTFAIEKETFKNNFDLIKKYGINDHAMFSELNKFAQMFCPCYSCATHLASGCLAPNVKWLN
jgi:hypothetical protein